MSLAKSPCVYAGLVCLAFLLAGCASVHTTAGSGSGPGPGSGSGKWPQNITALKHIVFMVQENRSLDSGFGALREYWAQNGYRDESFDGLPQFNPSSGAAPLNGPEPSVPGCDPSSPWPAPCVWDPENPVAVYHFLTECVPSPGNGWNAEHIDWDYDDPLGLDPAKMNGFVYSAATISRRPKSRLKDKDGLRPMGYYDGDDFNYYYFMASNFATSDRWFSPLMGMSEPNREYLIAATSQGHAWPNSGNELLTVPVIFEELQKAGITWKIYGNPKNNCAGPPYDKNCLVSESTVHDFAWGQTIASKYPEHIATISQYFADLRDGTLPQVVQIESAEGAGLDEHPPANVQKGARYVSTLINALMQSSSWQDSVFILSYDESGGYYDHVSPQPEPSPDGIKPMDLNRGSVCGARKTGPTCDFVYTGDRLPLIVISPFTKRHYVSHTVADLTAILKLIETRFHVPPLTKRDAAQMDMKEFFDFINPPWMTPPSPPEQNMGGACDASNLP